MDMLRKCPYRQIFITGDRHEGFRYNYQCGGRHIRRRPWHAFEGRAEGTFSTDTHAGPWGMHHFYRHIRSVEGHAPRGERHTGNYGHHASHRVPGDRFSSRGMDSDRKMDGSFRRMAS